MFSIEISFDTIFLALLYCGRWIYLSFLDRSNQNSNAVVWGFSFHRTSAIEFSQDPSQSATQRVRTKLSSSHWFLCHRFGCYSKFFDKALSTGLWICSKCCRMLGSTVVTLKMTFTLLSLNWKAFRIISSGQRDVLRATHFRFITLSHSSKCFGTQISRGVHVLPKVEKNLL